MARRSCLDEVSSRAVNYCGLPEWSSRAGQSCSQNGPERTMRGRFSSVGQVSIYFSKVDI
jgi:hypothetical protein